MHKVCIGHATAQEVLMPNPDDNSSSTTVCSCKTQVKRNVDITKRQNFHLTQVQLQVYLIFSILCEKQMATKVAKD